MQGESLDVRIDDGVADPPYEQIRTQIADQVARGALQPGDRLPTVRRLAADLGIAANTAARAYRELESRGVIQTRGRAGTFVSGDETERVAKEAAATYVDRVRALGLTPDEALALVQRQLSGPSTG
ncbi:GntR family transcriptional regulator [Nocardioides sp.]|uniref:GntR family transcriptional regulator n=1 Tax=Nocardioides sp. TaxID=35761 RepID=UPI003D0F51D6